MTKKRHGGDSTIEKARSLWRLGLLKDRPTAKSEFTSAQRGYITKLAKQFSNEIEKPELFVFKKLSPERAKQLRGLGYDVANNTVPIRAPYAAKVRITRDRITVENAFEKNTVFLDQKDFLQRAKRYTSADEENDEEFDEDSEPGAGYWRFSMGGDVSSKIYARLDQALNEVDNYRDESKRDKKRHRGPPLPVFSEQKMSGLRGFTAEEIREAKETIKQMVPAGTVRKNGKKKKAAR